MGIPETKGRTLDTISYQNFDIIIDTIDGDGHFKLTLHGARAGDTSETVFIPEGLRRLNCAHDVRFMDKKDLKELGAEFYHCVLGNRVGKLLSVNLQQAHQTGMGLRIRLRLPPELTVLPWELLLNPETGDFFSVSERSPIIRYLPVENPRPHGGVAPPLRILVMISNPEDVAHLDGEGEWAFLERALDPLVELGLIMLDRLEAATFAALQDQLRKYDYHVFHFIGHGFFEHSERSSCGLTFESEEGYAHPVAVDELASVLNDHSTLTLTFLNACEAGRSMASSAFAGVAQGLIQGGLPAAIAMQARLSDRCAVELSKSFYKAIADGYSIEASLAEARKYVRTYHASEWGIPVMFSRLEDSQLIEAPNAALIPPEFQVDDSDLEKLNALFVPPDAKGLVKTAQGLLSQRKILLIKGGLGIGKRSLAMRMAAQLLEEGGATAIVKTYRNTPLKEAQHFRNMVIIVPDALGLTQWERREIEHEIVLIERLSQQNWIILTTNHEVLEEALNETRLEEWSPIRSNVIELSAESYSDKAYLTMIRKHLEWAVSQGVVTDRQAKWMKAHFTNSTKIREIRSSLENIKTPLDIRRLVLDRLSRLNGREDFLRMIRQSVDLDSEIQSWFSSVGGSPLLTDDLQCFLLALAIFEGFESSELWQWYTEIVTTLKELNPGLAMRPFGAMAGLLEPYVSIRRGMPSFSHPSYREATLGTLSDSYREYFFEVLPIFEKVLYDQAHDKSSPHEWLQDTVNVQQARDAIRDIACRIAPTDLAPLRSLVERMVNSRGGANWAAGAAIFTAASRSTGHKRMVLGELRQWIKDSSYQKRWTAAVTYGSLAESATFQARTAFERLVKDKESYVRSVIPSAIRRLVKKEPGWCRKIYKQLAADSDEFTRRKVSNVLRALAYQDEVFVESVFEEWRALHSRYRLWTLARTCLIIPGPLKDKRLSILTDLLENRTFFVLKAVVDALLEKDLQVRRAWSLLEELVSHSEANAARIPELASLIETRDQGLAWHVIEDWAVHERFELRLAAAHVVAHWKLLLPERSKPVLARLATQPNLEIAEYAVLTPVDPIPSSFFEAVRAAELPEVVSSAEEEARDFDFSLDILG